MAHRRRSERARAFVRSARAAVLAVALSMAAAALPPAAAAQNADPRPAGQIADSVAIARLARTLAAPHAADSAKAAVLYEWVARSIAYDVPRYLAGDIAAQPAETVYHTRVGVCSGYVALYQRMAEEVGLRAEVIHGYAKGFDYVFGQRTDRTNHAWLAVRIDGRWRLVDPTWASGAVHDGRFVPRFTWDYFLVEPDVLVLSHFPRRAEWQLLRRPMDRREFERLPAVPMTLLARGFAPAEIRAAGRRGTLRDLPLVADEPGIRIVRAPVSGTIRAADAVAVEIVWPGAVEVAFVSGDRYTHLEQHGDTFTGEAQPGIGAPLFVVGRTTANEEFRTVLLYQVR